MLVYWRVLFAVVVSCGLLGVAPQSANAQLFGGLFSEFGSPHHHHDAMGHMIDDNGHHIDNHGHHSGHGVYEYDYDDGDYYYYPQTQYYYPQQQQQYYYPPANIPQNLPPQAIHADRGPITITNPKESSASLKYSLNNYSYTIAPGESQQLRNDRNWVIAFGSGGSKGNVRYTLSTGVYTFTATNDGWDLFHRKPMAAPAASDAPPPPPAPAPPSTP